MPSSLPPSFTFSQSSLQDYADCPRRFQLRYIERLAYPAAEAEPALENERRMAQGAAFHRLAQQFMLGIPVEKLARLASTPDLRRWWEKFAYAKEIEELRIRGARFPEVTLSAPIAGARLAAKYDLLAITPDTRFLIYDWKTYHRRPRNEHLAARWQTRVYRALLAAAGAQFNDGNPPAPDQCGMIYWFTDYPDDPARFPYSASQFQRDWDALTGMVREIRAAQTFSQTEDTRLCAYCPYRSYCERGAQAGDLDAADLDPESEAQFDVNFEQIGEIAF